ncbi:hypothetical protein B1218_35390, partial [Pseudomonas ogarae]
MAFAPYVVSVVLLHALAVRGPISALDALTNLDDRIAAHLDGLRIAGSTGLVPLLTRLGPRTVGEMFASVLLAFGAGNAKELSLLSVHLR